VSNWTHPQCEACWVQAESVLTDDGFLIVRRPHRVIEPEIEACCYCGRPTIWGIYRRDDPAGLSHCRGHEERQ
jgi:hypothetical protein